MEAIINYKLSDFLLLEDPQVIKDYIAVLELLAPLEGMKHIKKLTFGNVISIRDNLNSPTLENLLECVQLLTELSQKEILEMDIIQFYSIINGIKEQAIEIANMEESLADDETSWEMEAVNAPQRMAKYGVLNIINHLAGDDITKWKMIEDMPYMTVFAKLMMDKDRNKINKEVSELQKRNTPQQ